VPLSLRAADDHPRHPGDGPQRLGERPRGRRLGGLPLTTAVPSATRTLSRANRGSPAFTDSTLSAVGFTSDTGRAGTAGGAIG
jgi:hypothetical protein